MERQLDCKAKIHPKDCGFQPSIEKEKFSETTSKLAFAKLSKEFKKDKLNFYTDGYYYNFRNKLIEVFAKHISDPRNLTYFLNTVAYYTYDDPDVTPCPYKLLVGSEKGSVVKEVSSDETNREIFFNSKPTNYINIKTKYDNKQQTFTLYFTYKPLNVKFEGALQANKTKLITYKSFLVSGAW